MEDTLSFFPWRVFAKPQAPPRSLRPPPRVIFFGPGDGHGRVVSGGQRGLRDSERCHGRLGSYRPLRLPSPGPCLPRSSPQSGLCVRLPALEGGRGRGQQGGSPAPAECLPRPRSGERRGCSRPCGAKEQHGGKTFGCGVFAPSCPHSGRKACFTPPPPPVPPPSPAPPALLQPQVFSRALLVT